MHRYRYHKGHFVPFLLLYTLMKLNKVQEAILKTLSFFDIFDRPLTFGEIQLYLYETKANEKVLEKELKILIAKNKVGKLGDWYFLPGRLKFLQEYPERQKLTQQLITKAQKYLWRLNIIPFIEMVAVVNSVAFSTVHKNSDIDIFITTSKNRLYTARSFLILYLKLFGVYQKRGEENAGKISAGFYVDASRMNLEKIKLRRINDIYLDFWLIALDPVYGQEAYRKFIRANKWILKKFPNFNLQLKVRIDNWYFPVSEKKNIWTKFLEWFLGGIMGNLIEKLLAVYHIRHIWRLPENHLPTSTTIARKHILKLHARDRREEFARLFEKEIEWK